MTINIYWVICWIIIINFLENYVSFFFSHLQEQLPTFQSDFFLTAKKALHMKFQEKKNKSQLRCRW